MKITAYISGILLLFFTFSFLYLGNIIDSFNDKPSAFYLGLGFDLFLLLSTVLFSVIFIRMKKRFYLVLTVIPLLLYIVHEVIIWTIGFKKAYSYGMDVLTAVIYMIVLTRSYELFFKKKGTV